MLNVGNQPILTVRDKTWGCDCHTQQNITYGIKYCLGIVAMGHERGGYSVTSLSDPADFQAPREDLVTSKRSGVVTRAAAPEQQRMAIELMSSPRVCSSYTGAIVRL